MEPTTVVETPAAPAAPAAKLTPFQEWANDPAAQTAESSATQIDNAAETAPASEPETPAAEKKPLPKGLKKRFSALTSEIRELRAQLDAGKPAGGAAATEPGVATPPKEQKPAETGKPVAANFDSYEQYVEALTDWKLEQRDALRKQTEAQTSQQATVKAQVEAARARHADYDQVVTDKVPVSAAMAEVMVASEQGAEIAYYLGQNPQEAARIAKLTPAQAGAALAKIEAQLEKPAAAGASAETAKPKAPASKAPAPPKVITGGSGSGDPEPDPKNYTAWEKWYNRQQKAREE